MKRRTRFENQIELLQGTLDLLILQTLQWGPRHGYGISQAIRTNSSETFQVDTGSLYPALHRLERQQFIAAEWKTSENRQRTRVYRLTARARRSSPRSDPGGTASSRRSPASSTRPARANPDAALDGRDDPVDEEIRSHLEMAVRDRMERGETAAGRGRRAPRVRQRRPDQRGHQRHASVSLARAARAGPPLRRAPPGAQPGVRVASTLSLALGIGATTALFQLIDAVQLRRCR